MPTSSWLAVHERAIAFGAVAVAVRLPGAVGGTVSDWSP
jgi:hypothetical protein